MISNMIMRLILEFKLNFRLYYDIIIHLTTRSYSEYFRCKNIFFEYSQYIMN